MNCPRSLAWKPLLRRGLIGSVLPGILLVGILASGLASAEEKTTKQPAKPEAAPKIQRLFDGKSLGKWEIVKKHDFEDHGKIYVKGGAIHLGEGSPASGIRWTGDLPRMKYELSFDAMRVEGGDFFVGLTFPVGKSNCSWIVGGWGGSITGLSNINDQPAAENETTKYIRFKNKKWYHFRLKVMPDVIECWIDGKEIINVKTAKKKLSIWWEQEPALPLGFTTWITSAAYKNIQIERLDKPACDQ